MLACDCEGAEAVVGLVVVEVVSPTAMAEALRRVGGTQKF